VTSNLIYTCQVCHDQGSPEDAEWRMLNVENVRFVICHNCASQPVKAIKEKLNPTDVALIRG